ncbi:hypothetical protein Q3O97_05700 [Ralstonia pseudosolanacearum]|uniref:hypothetical protein n=1 Tax=Ralstonia pseudosolanacearum TaxID=1310165 RepID=UPI0027088727|nr:hypothetical protein [Ralstonia pseudosolanacearum]MDO3615332.1 hypothetical protein [Ralstonia pseudosolanacearum]
MKRFAAALVLTLAAGASRGITVASYGDNSIANTADTVADLVPNDLGQVLDAADLVLVVEYDSTALGSDLVCHAMAGISRRPEGDSTARVPALRAVHTVLKRNVVLDEASSKGKCTVEAVRAAVKTLTEFPVEVLLRSSKASVADRSRRPPAKPALII